MAKEQEGRKNKNQIQEEEGNKRQEKDVGAGENPVRISLLAIVADFFTEEKSRTSDRRCKKMNLKVSCYQPTT